MAALVLRSSDGTSVLVCGRPDAEQSISVSAAAAAEAEAASSGGGGGRGIFKMMALTSPEQGSLAAPGAEGGGSGGGSGAGAGGVNGIGGGGSGGISDSSSGNSSQVFIAPSLLERGPAPLSPATPCQDGALRPPFPPTRRTLRLTAARA